MADTVGATPAPATVVPSTSTNATASATRIVSKRKKQPQAVMKSSNTTARRKQQSQTARVCPGKKESILRKKLSSEIEHQRTLGDMIDAATLNFTPRTKALFDYHQSHVLSNITNRFQLKKRSRLRVSEIREYTKESLEEHKNFNLWSFVVDSEEIRTERHVMIAGVYVDCLIRCYYQIYEIMVFRISREEFEYFCLVNCYDSIAEADSGNLKALRSVSPVKASSSVVLFYLADVCAVIAKARDRIPDLFNPGISLFTQKVNDFSEQLDGVIRNLHLVYPTIEEPNPVNDWNVFFTSQKRIAIKIACEIEKLLRNATAGKRTPTSASKSTPKIHNKPPPVDDSIKKQQPSSDRLTELTASG